MRQRPLAGSQAQGTIRSATKGVRSPAPDGLAPAELQSLHRGVSLSLYEETQNTETV